MATQNRGSLGLLAAAALSWAAAACDSKSHRVDAGADATSPADCSDVPQCEFACPEGTVNPIDEAGCEHTCECVKPGGSPGSLRMFYTCGDPVCRGYTGGSAAPLCSNESAGDVCRVEGGRCDPQDECNRVLVCASEDPTLMPGGCPISRRRFKTEIDYLDRSEVERIHDALLAIKLATWRYAHAPERRRLGFLIDDDEGSLAVDAVRDQVDVYGYTSMAVAAIQLQATQIDRLQREVASLKRTAARSRSAKGPGLAGPRLEANELPLPQPRGVGR
jgi:hypothetical protein